MFTRALNLCGTSSEVNTARDMDMGVAMPTARAEVVSVPMSAGRIPYTSSVGFQTAFNTKSNPYLGNTGYDVNTREAVTPTTIISVAITKKIKRMRNGVIFLSRRTHLK